MAGTAGSETRGLCVGRVEEELVRTGGDAEAAA